MKTHNHNHKCACEHRSVKYCSHCSTVYCEGCNQEWTSKPNYSFTYTYPWWQTYGETYKIGDVIQGTTATGHSGPTTSSCSHK